LWNSDKKPSWKILIETAGVVDEDASAVAFGAGSFLGFAAFAASAFAFASSRVPNNSVKTVSSEVLISATLAHLIVSLVLQSGVGS
jgi:hypothetical protein